MAYQVKEIFYTLQGEGAQAGRAAVFCRFAGCNLWSGREEDRSRAQCQFCDTDFVGTDGTGGGRYANAAALAAQMAALWPASDASTRFCVLTGGEPLLQVDAALIDALHAENFAIALETNGTQPLPTGSARPIDWVCVSPKIAPYAQGRQGERWVLQQGDELKLVWPPNAHAPTHTGFELAQLAQLPFTHFFLQPMDGVLQAQHTRDCIAACLAHPRWRLSVQTHKALGIR